MKRLLTAIRRGRGPVSGTIKRVVLRLLSAHLPVNVATRPLFASCYRLHVLGRESLIWFCRFFWFEPLFRSQCRSIGKAFRMEQLPYIVGHGNIHIGEGVQFSGKPSLAFNNRHLDAPDVTIGSGTYVGHACSFAVAKSVHIGAHCLLAGGVSVSDFDGHPLDAAKRRARETSPPEDIKPVVVGDDVWIGTAAVILKGVTVGDRAIIGTRAVVTKDVPPDCVVAGNPARVVKSLSVSQPGEIA